MMPKAYPAEAQKRFPTDRYDDQPHYSKCVYISVQGPVAQNGFIAVTMQTCLVNTVVSIVDLALFLAVVSIYHRRCA
jgi:hypothetical protein